MSRDRVVGVLLLTMGLLGIVVYGWLVFFSTWSWLVLQLTGFVAVSGILVLVAWIGYVLASTPPPEPIEDIEGQVEEELKGVKEETEEKAVSSS